MSITNFLDHVIFNVPKGWPAPYALDKHATMQDGETIYKGMCMYLNSDAEFVAGLAPAAVGVIAHRNSVGSDVQPADAGGATGGVMAGLVTTGGFEIEVSLYDDEQSYSPNDYLTAVNTGEDRGVITRGTPYVDTIIGVVSDGVLPPEDKRTAYSQSMLRFWTYHLPPTEVSS